MNVFQNKYISLERRLKKLEHVVVAFSGGVDSTFLLKVAQHALGDKVVALSAQGSIFSQEESALTKSIAAELGVKHKTFFLDINAIDGFCSNPPDRCYLCKRALMKEMISMTEVLSEEQGQKFVLVEGSNMDDDRDYRPGVKALNELNVISPLKDVGLTKDEIRKLSKLMGLPTWDKPAAACLASRFVYNENITEEKLGMVEQGEKFLRQLGFAQVRIRVHGDLARVETEPSEIEKFLKEDIRIKVTKKLKELGFTYVTADLTGYRMGSMNETLCD